MERQKIAIQRRVRRLIKFGATNPESVTAQMVLMLSRRDLLSIFVQAILLLLSLADSGHLRGISDRLLIEKQCETLIENVIETLRLRRMQIIKDCS